jgi:hypothetical protein
MYTVFALYSPSHAFSHFLSSSCWYQCPQTGPVLLVLQFWKRKSKWHFCLFKIATQGASLWHFHVYMYYNPNWFISSVFLLSTLVLFFWWFLLV